MHLKRAARVPYTISQCKPTILLTHKIKKLLYKFVEMQKLSVNGLMLLYSSNQSCLYFFIAYNLLYFFII
ncbi:hypothetical protein HMPREF0091_10935 [Fannyhessea vaginae DSM 15829]|uniref:Uncharacterized protein n=1 Tax=Fannyhessea vaginae DSM 15829 TaxID=525256 RepID=F1T635_9ACTN|nr:hypothetical protein HMPREF0091_10935 [Fannyhessea vaginae DSM 15829]SSZ02551.1 Uncharacterised protein [Fannyhessea vaginae]